MEFQFFTKLDQTVLLGIQAKNAEELLEGVRSVPLSSIYYHTHHFLHHHHYLSPEPPNDFAYWMAEVMSDSSLGEALSSIDIIQFHKLSALRERIEEILAAYVGMLTQTIDCPRGGEFHFMASQTFVLKTPFVAHTLSEFGDFLPRISLNSLYYHVFDAKMRLEKGENDFSAWFKAIGKPELAEEVLRLDPYAQTLGGLRKRILVMVRKHDSH